MSAFVRRLIPFKFKNQNLLNFSTPAPQQVSALSNVSKVGPHAPVYELRYQMALNCTSWRQIYAPPSFPFCFRETPGYYLPGTLLARFPSVFLLPVSPETKRRRKNDGQETKKRKSRSEPGTKQKRSRNEELTVNRRQSDDKRTANRLQRGDNWTVSRRQPVGKLTAARR